MKWNDYEVLGVGGERRRQILETAVTELRLHRHFLPKERVSFYEAVLQETLTWLKPNRVVEVTPQQMPGAELQNLLKSDFNKQFPRTSAELAKSHPSILDQYLQELEWQGPLLSDHYRYFPQFLKGKVDPGLVTLAQQEWLRSFLSFNDFGLPPFEKGFLKLNPSLQTLRVAVEDLNRGLQEGLYLFYFNYDDGTVQEHCLDLADAILFDVLEEDRKFRFEQVIAHVLLPDQRPVLPEKEWRKKLSYLISQGMILTDIE